MVFSSALVLRTHASPSPLSATVPSYIIILFMYANLTLVLGVIHSGKKLNLACVSVSVGGGPCERRSSVLIFYFLIFQISQL